MRNTEKIIVLSFIKKIFITAGFFGAIIFFVLNSHAYTLTDSLIWIVLITIFCKTIFQVMFSLLICFGIFEVKRKEIKIVDIDEIN